MIPDIEYVELTFKNQYIGIAFLPFLRLLLGCSSVLWLGRSDMWRLKHSLIGKCLATSQVAETTEGVRFRVDNMSLRVQDEQVIRAKSGVVSKHTKLTFRSASAKVFILIQLSEVCAMPLATVLCLG